MPDSPTDPNCVQTFRIPLGGKDIQQMDFVNTSNWLVVGPVPAQSSVGLYCTANAMASLGGEKDRHSGENAGCTVPAIVRTKRFGVYGGGTDGGRNGGNHCRAGTSQGSHKADDDCFSLFYDKVPGDNGAGFSVGAPISSETTAQLRTIFPDYTRLPFDFYKFAVESLPIVCVDVVCKRSTDSKFLLFYRRDKPAANIWWWPGGRMFKSETFFDTATRKILDETGLRGSSNWSVRPVTVLNVWNTFFPDSNWDADRAPGREGTQTVNITVFCELHLSAAAGEMEDKSGINESKGNESWAVEAKRWVSADEVLNSRDSFDKYVYLNVEEARTRKLL
jgi:ADP-ribose pyrophosphatase YjhB (NUDIX family)